MAAKTPIVLLFQEHRQTYGNTREPLLENLTSEYDLELFRRAQARASEDLVRVLNHNMSHSKCICSEM